MSTVYHYSPDYTLTSCVADYTYFRDGALLYYVYNDHAEVELNDKSAEGVVVILSEVEGGL